MTWVNISKDNEELSILNLCRATKFKCRFYFWEFLFLDIIKCVLSSSRPGLAHFLSNWALFSITIDSNNPIMDKIWIFVYCTTKNIGYNSSIKTRKKNQQRWLYDPPQVGIVGHWYCGLNRLCHKIDSRIYDIFREIIGLFYANELNSNNINFLIVVVLYDS